MLCIFSFSELFRITSVDVSIGWAISNKTIKDNKIWSFKIKEEI